MTPVQALENLNKASAAASLSRDIHIVVMNSIEILKKFIDDNSKEKPVSPHIENADNLAAT